MTRNSPASRRCLPLSILIVALGLVAQATSSGADVDFLRDVRPILSTHCFKCHGPDEETRKGGLRLDIREEALKPGESGEPGIVPGKPDASEVILRVLSDDRDDVMPPPKTKHELTDAQKETLKRWVAAGAEYTPHWAFIAPKEPQLPTVNRDGWVRNPIDSFILARLEKEGLSPSAEADRYALCRRVYLDLIGIPPTPEEADAFVNDTAPDAWERLVDRLLASPHYGERWARRWLDLARYADTNGYEKDRQRDIWPYRDWVIRALNADMPFNEFTIKQLAGDMIKEKVPGNVLPGKAAEEDLIATGFHRNTMLNEEGGIDPLEFRYHAMVDRVSTTGTAWMGLTVGCAQCHTHKYDPLLHTEYFQLMAFLNNADEPELELHSPDRDAAYEKNLEKARELLAKLPEKWPVETVGSENEEPASETSEAVDRAFSTWHERERERTVNWTRLIPVEAKSNMPLLEIYPEGSVIASGDVTKDDTYIVKFRDLPQGVTALRLEALSEKSLPGGGPGLAYYEGPKGDFFLSELEVSEGDRRVKIADASQSYAQGKTSAKLALDGDAQTGWSCSDRLGQDHHAVFVLAEPLAQAGELTVKMQFSRHYACPMGRFAISVTTDPRKVEARALPHRIERLLTRSEEQLSEKEREELREHFLLSAPELASEAKRILDLRKPPRAQTTLVMRERPPSNPRPTFLYNRGEFLQPKQQVEPGVPAFLPPMPPDASRNRLTFAQWLVSPEHPLTARVTVNRQWQAFFGEGLVRTLGDFGLQGELPSHPELLDWLAIEFVKQGWSLKKLHRLIVTSATYRQSSRVTPELLASDPQNKLLARGPRVRIEAELIRDVALRASGLLSEKMYGPPVRPPQPPGVTETAYGGFKWEASKGEDRYRRALYTFAKRSAPFAMFNTFDAPTGEVCVARRDVSNTPLQSLTLLNDTMMTECAQALGDLAAKEQGSAGEKAAFIFRRCLTRPPKPAELEKITAFAESQRERFESGELKASELVSESSEDATERAVWTTVARAILNLDETITKN